jgi:aminoglycoside phosphotransferase (APT) family kinase protein
MAIRTVHRRGGKAVLSESDIVPYLLERKLIGESAVVHGRLRVVDASRRNRVFVVTSDRSPAYVVKQPRSGDDPAVAREVEVLRELGSLDVRVGVRRLLPAVIAYDACEQVLVLQTEADSRDLREQFARGRFSIALARASGRALARLHHLPPDIVGPRPEGMDPAWPLSWHRPWLEDLFDLSAGSIELLRLVQSSYALCDALDDLLESWRGESLIHGDARWENWITLPAPASRGRTRVVMADWELAGGGDPCLDVGSFLGEYLLAWLASIPVIDIGDPGRLLPHARYPMQRIQPSLRAFWIAYLMTTREHAEACRLRRAVRFAAVRLLQAAVEQARDTSELRAHTILTLQLAVNLLRRPTDAAERVLALPVPRANS